MSLTFLSVLEECGSARGGWTHMPRLGTCLSCSRNPIACLTEKQLARYLWLTVWPGVEWLCLKHHQCPLRNLICEVPLPCLCIYSMSGPLESPVHWLFVLCFSCVHPQHARTHTHTHTTTYSPQRTLLSLNTPPLSRSVCVSLALSLSRLLSGPLIFLSIGFFGSIFHVQPLMSVHWFCYFHSLLPLHGFALPMFCMSVSIHLLTFKFAGTSRPHLNLQLRGAFAIFHLSLSFQKSHDGYPTIHLPCAIFVLFLIYFGCQRHWWRYFLWSLPSNPALPMWTELKATTNHHVSPQARQTPALKQTGFFA